MILREAASSIGVEMCERADVIDFELYGGRRAFLVDLQARVAHGLGRYGKLDDVEWGSIRRLVFVCKGNICRSAYAAERARVLGVRAASFGLEASDGAPPDPAAAHNANLRGVDLSGHSSVRLQPSLINRDDLVLVFEPGQLAAVRERCGDRTHPLSLLGIWTRPTKPHIHDPYGHSDRYFQQCFTIIDANIAALARRVPRAHR